MCGALFLGIAGFILFKLFCLSWMVIRYSQPVRRFLSKRKELKLAGDWAVITGSTDGIGKAFAEELAGDGLNIFLISRNAEKLALVAQDLERVYKVRTKVFVADFKEVCGAYFLCII